MSTKSRYLTTLLVASAAAASIAVAPVAAAAPQCTNTGPNTTQCETQRKRTDRHIAPANNNYGYWGYPIIGFGGWGFGW